MSNEINQKPQTELDISGEVEPEVMGVAEQPSLGSNQLAAAREAKRLAVGDVAYTLKVSNKVIEALEASDWQSLPGRTFVPPREPNFDTRFRVQAKAKTA